MTNCDLSLRYKDSSRYADQPMSLNLYMYPNVFSETYETRSILEFRILEILWAALCIYTVYLTVLVRSVITHSVTFTEDHMNSHTE